jgi:hypothetical protein
VLCAGPAPAPGGGRQDDARLRITRAARRTFGGSSAAALDPMLAVYLSDMAAPYGLALHEDLLRRGSGHSYGEMVAALLPEVVTDGEPVDLLIFAFGMHDVIPGRSTACFLSHLCPGAAMGFAVCDQGTVAAFTGLLLASRYLAGGDCRRVLLVTAEQAVHHYDLPSPAAMPTGHAAVALLCEPAPDRADAPAAGGTRAAGGLTGADGGAGTPEDAGVLGGSAGLAELAAVRQHAGVAPEHAVDLLAAEIAAGATWPAAGAAGVTLLAGPGLAALPGAAGGAGPLNPTPATPPGPAAGPVSHGLAARLPVEEVLAAPAGQPGTGLWSELAAGLAGWAGRSRLVLLADYEPRLRYLCLAAVRGTGATAAARYPPGTPASPVA